MGCKHIWVKSEIERPHVVIERCKRCNMQRLTHALWGEGTKLRNEVLGKVYKYYIRESKQQVYKYIGKYRVVLLPKWRGNARVEKICKNYIEY